MRRLASISLLLAVTAGMARDDKEDGFLPLFNGKDLTGWQVKGSKEDLAEKTEAANERIGVADSSIVMRAKDKKGKGGILELQTKKTFSKGFHLKLEFKASLKSDSGVYIRGPQLQVRDFIRRGEQPGLKKVFKDDGWNTLDIVVKNGVVATIVNGKALTDKDEFEMTFKGGEVTSAKLNGKDVPVKAVQVRKGAVAHCSCNGVPFETMVNIPDDGRIGLQAETGQFEFRNVRVKEME